FRTEAMQEEREDPIQSGMEVGRGLAAPRLQRDRELAPAQHRDEQVAIDALRRREVGIRDGAESREPGRVALDAPPEALSRGDVQLVVVFGEPEARRERGRVLVPLLQERVDELTER